MTKYTTQCYYCGKEDIERLFTELKHNFTMNPRGIIDTTATIRFHGFACRECVDIWNNALKELRIPKADEFNLKTAGTS